ncbi:hypothetical protein, partial [Bradyrhizobium sp. NBAIM08]|uniref:hypothetical protein n=1 Tax=Bradyrhizobium sp. NBAIM08 TaxID=2793815 RepID=UPI001CD57567
VSKPLLERAFAATYGIRIEDLFANLDVAITTYRFAVSEVIPEATKIAWAEKAEEIERRSPMITKDQFVFQFLREEFESQFGRDYRRPGFFRRLIGLVIRILPKFGPLKAFSFKTPPPEAEQMFFETFDTTK